MPLSSGEVSKQGRAATPVTPPAPSPPSEAAAESGPLVLLVEDDAAVRGAFFDLLRHAGCRVESAATLAEASKKLDRGRPTCVLLDLLLPDGCGIQLLRRLRSSGSTAKVAVVSGTADASLRSKVAKLRPDASFPKPVDVLALFAWVRGISAPDPTAAAC